MYTFDSCVQRSFSSSSRSISPNGLRMLPINPDFPTAFLTELNPDPTAPFAPTTPATELVTLPSTLYAPVTAFFPVATVCANCSALAIRG